MKETIRDGSGFCDVMERYPDLFPKESRDVFDADECQELSCAVREAFTRAWGEQAQAIAIPLFETTGSR